MTSDHRPQKKLIFGCSGSGKSTMFHKLISAPGWPYRFVFDWDLKVSRALGWQAATSLRGLCQLLDAGRPVVFYPEAMFSSVVEGFAFFCRFVFAQVKLLPGKKVFGVDELQFCLPRHAASFPESFLTLLDYGRNHGLDMVLAAQRLDKMNKAITGQTTEIFVFAHSEFDTEGLDELKAIGIDPEAVKALPHATIDGKVGWIYKHGLTGRTETVTHDIN